MKLGTETWDGNVGRFIPSAERRSMKSKYKCKLYQNLNISVKLLDAVIIGGLLAIAFLIMASVAVA